MAKTQLISITFRIGSYMVTVFNSISYQEQS